MPFIKIKGVNFYYEWRGPEGAEIIVFNNGILMNTAGWAYQTFQISKFYRLLLYDCRGQGQSDHPEGDYSIELHAEDLKNLLEALGVTQVHLAGISYGGEIALVFAILWPEKVKSLFISSAVSEVHPHLHGLIDKWIAAAQTGNGKLFYRVTVNDNFSEKWLIDHPEWENKSMPYYEAMDFAAVIRLCKAFTKLNFTEQLHKIEAPTMLVTGEKDLLKPYKPYMKLIAKELRKSNTIILEGAGHACNIEVPSSWNAVLLGFFKMNH